MYAHWHCFIIYKSFPAHRSGGTVLAGAVQSLRNKALFQTLCILNKQGGKDNRCAKVKRCVKGIRAGESPQHFLFHHAELRESLALAAAGCILLLSSAHFSTFILVHPALGEAILRCAE